MLNTAKYNIAAGLALVALLITPAAFAADSKASAGKSSLSTINTDWLKNRFDDESPESVKLRSAPGDPVAGKEKSQLCQGCHGEKGMTDETMIPHLAGQYGKYIAKELRNFQTGERTHQIMNAMAATISDDDLADISAYFASMPKMSGDGSGETSKAAEVGKQLFLVGDMRRMVIGCTNCHGVGGKGRAPNISMFPVIGGQQAGYLRGQLINWRSAQRANSANAIMNRIAEKLTDAEIDSLAAYISSL
jgi:cytochrome c553